MLIIRTGKVIIRNMVKIMFDVAVVRLMGAAVELPPWYGTGNMGYGLLTYMDTWVAGSATGTKIYLI